jgi:hypothetical protein
VRAEPASFRSIASDKLKAAWIDGCHYLNESLSADAKDALAHDIPKTPDARRILAAALLAYGTRPAAVWSTRRLAIARVLHAMLPGASIVKMSGGTAFGITGFGEIPAPAPIGHLRRSATHRRLEIRGAFLACGSLSVEKRGGYHLEFIPPDAELFARLETLIRSEEFEAKTVARRERHVLYLKNAEHIIALLSAMGAYRTVFQLEDLRAVKETKNRVRRIVNTEAANLDRTIDAAAMTCDAVEALIAADVLNAQSAVLREAARLRLDSPQASIAELAAACVPPVGKSTFGGRLASLRRLAARLSTE